jgi:hypothetical protein
VGNTVNYAKYDRNITKEQNYINIPLILRFLLVSLFFYRIALSFKSSREAAIINSLSSSIAPLPIASVAHSSDSRHQPLKLAQASFLVSASCDGALYFYFSVQCSLPLIRVLT